MLLHSPSGDDLFGPLAPARLVDGEGVALRGGGGGGDAREAVAEDGAVFDGHAGARGEVGERGVDGVAEEGEAAAGVGPGGVEGGADAEAPFRDGFAEGEEFGDAVGGLGRLVGGGEARDRDREMGVEMEMVVVVVMMEIERVRCGWLGETVY